MDDKYRGMTYGGNGSHWATCHLTHWDCRLAKLEDFVKESEHLQGCAYWSVNAPAKLDYTCTCGYDDLVKEEAQP